MYYMRKKKSATNKKNSPSSELRKWINKLDKVMSLYIRMRDSHDYHFKYFRCISCGRVLPVDQADCGHYMSRRNMNTRFDTSNMNAECRRCNRFDASHLVGYRKNLVGKLGKMAWRQKYPNTPPVMEEIKRLGEQQVDLLEIKARQTKKWSVFELQHLYMYYAGEIKRMSEAQ